MGYIDERNAGPPTHGVGLDAIDRAVGRSRAVDEVPVPVVPGLVLPMPMPSVPAPVPDQVPDAPAVVDVPTVPPVVPMVDVAAEPAVARKRVSDEVKREVSRLAFLADRIEFDIAFCRSRKIGPEFRQCPNFGAIGM